MIRNNLKSLAFVNLLSLFVFTLLLVAVLAHTELIGLDRELSRLVFLYAGAPFVAVAFFFTRIGDFSSIVLISSIVVGYFLGKKRFDQVVVLGTTLVSVNIFVRFMKLAVGRVRPEHGYYILHDPSFPSGHAAVAAAFFTLVYLLLAKDIKGKAPRFYLAVSFLSLATFVGFSRVVLNVHWLSDVVAGLFLGVFFGTLGYAVFLLESGAVKKLKVHHKK